MESTKGYVKLSNVEMYYETAGQGEPVLLVHGIDGDSRMWEPQFWALAKHFHVIRFDLRGFGNTVMPAGNFQLLDDMRDLLLELGHEFAHIMGYSYGGTVAPSFAIKYPNLVKSLILIGPGMVGHNWSPLVQDYFQKFQDTFKNNDKNEMMRLLKWKSVYGPHRKQEGLDQICKLLDKMFLHALAIEPRKGTPLPTGDTRGELHTIDVPALILSGELDFDDYHSIAEFYYNKIKNSELVTISGAAHFMNLEKPDVVNQHAIRFLMKQKVSV
jgi:pimeloyl-ACP methyl ester carboxylesterase